MYGMRMNQLVAPTSFMTSISRRRANMAMRMVLKIRITATTSRTVAAMATTRLTAAVSASMVLIVSAAVTTSRTPGSSR